MEMQVQFICVLPGSYNRNMKVFPPLSGLNGVFESTFLFACWDLLGGFTNVTQSNVMLQFAFTFYVYITKKYKYV